MNKRKKLKAHQDTSARRAFHFFYSEVRSGNMRGQLYKIPALVAAHRASIDSKITYRIMSLDLEYRLNENFCNRLAFRHGVGVWNILKITQNLK